MSDSRTIAIVGAGPAGSALATFLRAEGLDVVLFTHGKRQPLIVGESLVPACVPFIRRMGIEDEIAAYSTWKGGATFVFGRDESMSVRFDEVRGAKTTYSYNVPRDRFDASCLEAARRSGARVVEQAAVLERDGSSDRLRLAEASLEAAGLGERQPDFIVDAGGRRRLAPRLLDIPIDDGDRRDTALHAHFEGIEVEIPGNVHTDRLEHGWLWRMEQFDNFLASDPVIRDYARPARRITPVLRYGNYQSISRRAVGENWALVGDSFGFVDPVFSSGLLIAFQAADWLAEALRVGTPDALARYERRLSHHLACWQRVTGWYYDGRILTLFKVGDYVRSTWPGRLMDFHFRKHMPRIFTGENATHPYSQWLIQFMVKYGLAGNDSAALRIR
ncbi:MAG: tryptophan 7-halogenase [Deltaproteobacteria bacterium]|nr:tryptophan 7-halogenase [Deltaproteobacteria bacterium]